VRFLVDAQLPPALAVWLRSKGQTAEHLFERGLVDAPDDVVWRMASAEGAVIVTKDHDFVEWSASRDPAPQVLWLRIGNVANISLVARLDAVWDLILESLANGARVVEVGRP
jgi:predicted nuclease of predicted toxin-antitoxin system